MADRDAILKRWTIITSKSFEDVVNRNDSFLFGDTNVAPANFREVTEEYYATDHYHTSYPTVAMDYRQLTRYNDGSEIGKRIHGSLYINSFGYGWMIEQCYWDKKVKYYFFELCQHDYETIEKRMSWWRGKCKKCGFENTIDSSD